MAAVTNIVFDLGRVLIDFDHRIAAQRLSALTRKPPEEIFELFFDSRLTRMFERGEIEPQAFYGKIKSKLRLKLKYDQFVPVWNEIFFVSEHNRQVLALARALKAKYTVSLLSNINELHFEYIREKFPIFSEFHHVFASFELGCMKPEPRIYSLALKALKANPGEVFYTDDRPELIEQARIMGFRAYVYSGYGQLVNDLTRCGADFPRTDSCRLPA